MKRLVSIVLLTLMMNSLAAQVVYFQGSRTSTLFDYKNSSGNTLSNLSGSMQTGMSLGLRLPLFKSDLQLVTEFVYQEYGASGSDSDLGNTYDWKFSNIGGNIGLSYEFFTPKITYNEQNGFSLMVGAFFSPEFIVQGTQTVNGQSTKLPGQEEFNKPFLFYKGSISVNYYFTRDYTAFLKYTAGKSFLVGNYEGQEQLKLIGHVFSVGFSIRIIAN